MISESLLKRWYIPLESIAMMKYIVIYEKVLILLDEYSLPLS